MSVQPIVLRKSGNTESYKKPHANSVRSLIRYGILKSYTKQFGYCDEADDVPTGKFHWNGKLFKIEYMSGCFYPFLLELTPRPVEFVKPQPSMFPQDKPYQETQEAFDAFFEGKLAYQNKDKNWVAVKDFNHWNKEPIMSRAEAQELME